MLQSASITATSKSTKEQIKVWGGENQKRKLKRNGEKQQQLAACADCKPIEVFHLDSPNWLQRYSQNKQAKIKQNKQKNKPTMMHVCRS